MIAVKYLVLCAGLLAWLSLIGYPIRRLLDRPGGPLAPVPAPFLGMAVVQLAGWYWLEAGGRGLRAPAVALTIVGVIALVATIVRDGRRRRRADSARMWLCGATLLGAAVVLSVNFSALLSIGFLTTADSGNNDAANYAVVADHLVRANFDADGPVAGYDFGQFARREAFGSTAVLGSFAALTDVRTFKLNEVVLFSFAALSVYSLALLLKELIPTQGAVAATISIATACTLMFIYIVNAFFIGQLMAMGIVPLLGLVGLRAAGPMPGRHRLRLLAAAAVLFIVLLSHYSHMAILAPPVVLPAALVASAAPHLGVRLLWTRFWRIVVVVVGGLASAIAIASSLAWLGLRTAIDRGTLLAGWPLPGFMPVELLGFMRQVTPLPSMARILWSVLILAIFGACAWLARGQHRVAVRFATATVATILLTYLLIIRREGSPSYRQWKWITFFQPLFVAVVLTVLLLGLDVAVQRHWRRWTTAILCAAAIAFGLVVSTNTGDGPGTALRDRRQLLLVSRDTVDLGVNPALHDLKRLNIDLAPYWDSMWATYFLADKGLRLQESTYWTVRPPEPGWTLVPRSVELSGETVRPVNPSYQLLLIDGGPTSTSAEGLDAAVQVSLDPALAGATVVTGTAQVTNTGTTAWLPSTGRLGSVNLGIQLADSTGAITDNDYGRISLSPGLRLPIPPRTTVTVPFSIPAPPDRTAELVFQPVAELVSWFGPQVHGTAVAAPWPQMAAAPSAPRRELGQQ
jgi:hypothetical protein